jgi:hypothetical protein
MFVAMFVTISEVISEFMSVAGVGEVMHKAEHAKPEL